MFSVSVPSAYPTHFINPHFSRKSSEQAKAPSLSVNAGDSIHFGMYKQRIEEAETRMHRVMTNKHATDADKRQARQYLEEVKRASEAPKKYCEKVKQNIKTVQQIGTGLLAVVATAAGLDGVDIVNELIPDEALDKIISGAAGVITGATTSRVGQGARKTFSEKLTDKKYPVPHYPEPPCEWNLAWHGKNPPHFFDEAGKRKVKSDRQLSGGDYCYDYADDSDEEGFK